MTQEALTTRTYVIVCFILIVLTFGTVAFSFADVPSVWHLVVGLIFAVCKASLVLLFFMHVLISTRVTWSVIAVVCFWAGLLFVLTLADYFSRGMVPIAPGH